MSLPDYGKAAGLKRSTSSFDNSRKNMEKEIADLRACLDRVRIQCTTVLGKTNHKGKVVASKGTP